MKKWRLKIGLYSIIAIVFCLCSSFIIHASETLPLLKETNVTFDAIMPMPDGENVLMILKTRDPVDRNKNRLMIVKMNLVSFEKEVLLSVEKGDAWFYSKIVQNETGFLITIQTPREDSLMDLESYVYSELNETLTESLIVTDVKDNYAGILTKEYLKLEDDTLTVYEIANNGEVESNQYKDQMFLGLKEIPYVYIRAKLASDQGYKETSITVDDVQYSLCKGEIFSEWEETPNCQLSTEEVQRELADKEYSRKISKMNKDGSTETIISPIGNQPLGLIRAKNDYREPQYFVTERAGQDIQISLPFLTTEEEASPYSFDQGFAMGPDAIYFSTDRAIVSADLQKEQADVLFTIPQLETAFFEEKIIPDENEYPIYEFGEIPIKPGISESFQNIKSEVGYFFEENSTIRIAILTISVAFLFLLANRLKRISRKLRSKPVAYQVFDTEQNSANKNVDKQIAKMRKSTQSEDEQAISEDKIRKDSSATDHQSNKDQDKQNQKLKSEYEKEMEKFNRKFGGGRWDK